MARNSQVEDNFRKIAEMGQRQSYYDRPNCKSFLSDLAEKITHKGFTTGDELIDCMVAWYPDYLREETIGRYHDLDEALRAANGEPVLVVVRDRNYRMKPRQVTSKYWLGKISGLGLKFDLQGGRCSIPTTETVYIDTHGIVSEGPDNITVLKAHVVGFDDGWGFSPSTPDYSKIYTVDGRVEEAFNPDDYASPEDANESRKPPIEAIIGTEKVTQYLATDSRLSKLADRISI